MSVVAEPRSTAEDGFVLPPVDIDELPRSQTGIVDLDPAYINVDAERFQFKQGGDRFGVTDRLQGITRFEPQYAGVIVVWQDLEGRLFIADGHQRHGLARRARELHGQNSDILIPSRIYKESEGFKAEDVKLIAAFKNMAEGTGTALDAARVIRAQGKPPDTLPPKSQLVQQGKALSQLSDETLCAIANGTISPEFGVVIAHALNRYRAALKDEDRQQKCEAMEMTLLKAFMDPAVRPADVAEAGVVATEVLRTGFEQLRQPVLFEENEYDPIIKERSEILLAAQRMLRYEASTYRDIIRHRGVINTYFTDGGNINAAKLRADSDELAIVRYVFDIGWKYHGIFGLLENAAEKFKKGKEALAANPDFVTDISKIDTALSDLARTLKLAKMKGDPDDGKITELRAKAACEFVAAVKAYAKDSPVVGSLRSSIRLKAEEPVPDAEIAGAPAKRAG